MTVREVISELMKYNMDADFRIYVNNKLIDTFGLSFGSTAGITESKSTDVNLEIRYSNQLDDTPASNQLEDQSTSPQIPPVVESKVGAHVGSNVSQGKGNWFAGTSWGS